MEDSMEDEQPFVRNARGRSCFCCGPDNPKGLHLQFERDAEHSVSTRFTAPQHWNGWDGVVHGGFQSMLLDEAMSWAVSTCVDGGVFVTAEMTVRFRKPLPVETELVVRARILKSQWRIIRAHASIEVAGARETYTEADGVFARVPEGFVETA